MDVAKDELVVSLGRLTDSLQTELYASKAFANNQKGFTQLLTWSRKLTSDDLPVHFVMEATGVYHECFAYFLADQGCAVSIVLPNKISNYFRSLEVKTVTDFTSAEVIARFGLSRKLEAWKRPDTSIRKLRQLGREREQIVAERTMVKNQMHAEQSEAFPNEGSLRRLKKRIVLLDKQEQEVKKELTEVINGSQALRKSVDLITSIPGVGLLTAAIVLGETSGFELVRNRRQLTSYAGLDVREKQSGTSVRGKPSISKRGNKYLRKSMYLPALAAKRSDSKFSAIFKRVVDKHGIKMKGVVAIQRRILELIYTIYKTQTPYDPHYELAKTREATSTKPIASQAGSRPPLELQN